MKPRVNAGPLTLAFLLLAARGSLAPARAAAPVPPARATARTWRGCAGVEEGIVVPAPAALRAPAAAPARALAFALSVSPPMRGCAVSVALVRATDGRDLLLIRLKPPAGARAGRYQGTLTLRRSTAVARVPLAMELLPFALMRPSKQYSVSRVPLSAFVCCAPQEADAVALRALRELGIGSLCLDAPLSDRAALEAAMRAAGLRGPVLAPVELEAVGESPPAPAETPQPPPPPVVGGNPFPVRWYALFSEAPPGAAADALKASGAMVAAHLADDPATAPSVDLPILDAGCPYCAGLLGRSGPVAASAVGWWRWDASTATPLENRLRCGALLWKSGLSGALMEIGPTVDPAWPLRWEGVRQGLLDSRYLTTLFALSRQVKDMDRSNPLPGQMEAAVATALKGLAKQPSQAAADRFRQVMITAILRLNRVVAS